MRTGHMLRRAVAFVLTWALCFQGLGAFAADIDQLDKFGGLERYNGIVFDYFESAQADIEGAIAVGGPSRIGTNGQYDFGASNYHEVMGPYPRDGYPTVVLGGKTELGIQGRQCWINVYGGPVYIAESARDDYLANSNRFSFYGSQDAVLYADDEVLHTFFADAYETSWRTVHSFDDAAAGSVRLDEFIGWTATYQSTFRSLARFEVSGLLADPADDPVLVIHVTDDKPVIREPNITAAFANYKYVVFNFPNAVDVQFTGGSVMVDGRQINTSAPVGIMQSENDFLRQYATRIIWNFPRASTVKIANCGVVGSVLAPDALVEGNGGSINGMLIADSFITKGGMELHSFRLGKDIFEVDDTDDETAGRVVLYKYDAATSTSFEDYELVGGAAFALYQKDAVGAWQPYPDSLNNTHVVDEEGRLIIEDLEIGEYYLIETMAPPGYELDGLTEYHFTVRPGATGTPADTIYIYAPNQPYYGAFNLVKTDKYDPTITLAGAVYNLYLVMGDFGASAPVQFVASGTTDEDGILEFTDLREGNYYLVEVDPPDGYHTDHDLYEIEIDISDAGAVTVRVDGLVAAGGVVELDNEEETPGLYNVVVAKVVEGHEDIPISGVEFILAEDLTYKNSPNAYPDKDAYALRDDLHDWDDIDTEYTNELGHIYWDLPEGFYQVREAAQLDVIETFFVPLPIGALPWTPGSLPLSAEVVLDTAQPEEQAEEMEEALPDGENPEAGEEPEAERDPDEVPQAAEGDSDDGTAEAAFEADGQADAEPEADAVQATAESHEGDAEPDKDESGDAELVRGLFDPPEGAAYAERLALPMLSRSAVSGSGQAVDVNLFEGMRGEAAYADRLDFGDRLAGDREDDATAAAEPRAAAPAEPVENPQPGGEDPETAPAAQTGSASPEDEAAGAEGDPGEEGAEPDGTEDPDDGAQEVPADGEDEGDEEPEEPEEPLVRAADSPVVAPFGSGIYIEITNTAPGAITVIKEDVDTHRPVAGATFGLYYNVGSWNFDNNGDLSQVGNRWVLVETGVSAGADGAVVFDNLIDGQYRVMEIEAPPGYEEIGTPEPVAVLDNNTLTDDHIVIIDHSDPDMQSYVFLARNPYAAGSIEILKVDGDSGLALSGASFRLLYWDLDDHRWLPYERYSHQSDAGGEITIAALPYGRYKIVEMSPPSGYQVETAYDKNELIFTITHNGVYADGTIRVENFLRPITTSPGGGGGNGGEYNPAARADAACGPAPAGRSG